MKNVVHGKTMETLRNMINVNLVSNRKDYLKMEIETKLHVSKNYLTMIWSQYIKVKLH